MAVSKNIIAKTIILLALSSNFSAFAQEKVEESSFKQIISGKYQNLKSSFFEKKQPKNDSISDDVTNKQITQPIQKPSKTAAENNDSKNISPRKTTSQCNCVKPEDVKSIVAAEIAKMKEQEKELFEKGYTSGHYLGLSYNYPRTTFHEEYTSISDRTTVKDRPSASNDGSGIGLSYKYAKNFNKFYIAPGIILEKYWNSTEGSEAIGENGRHPDITRVSLRYRYGITSDFGYDFNKSFSGYVTAGYVVTGFRTISGVAVSHSVYETALRDSYYGNLLLGGGFNFRINEKISLNFEANTQKFRVLNNTDTSLARQYSIDYRSHYVGRINVVKIGLSYNF